MDVITSHTNADFDSLASMLAARKLYKEAIPVFSGAQERNVRVFFSKVPEKKFGIEKIRNIDLNKITRLIIVDVKTPDRLGRFAEILNRPDLKIHVYDHHPHTEGDIHGEMEVIEPAGATTTILIEKLIENKIDITSEEATFLALGIYEETGSLSFTSTTPRDLQAAAYLLSKGADLNLVSDYIIKELDAEQIEILNDLLHSAKEFYFHGIKVIIAIASTEKYIGELALITHKMRDMENINALFVVVRMEDRIHIVARSRIPNVDVGGILKELGGGGHSTAASASIKELTIVQVQERLLDILNRKVTPTRVARDLMTAPLKTVQIDSTIKEAEKIMTQYGVNVLPVLDKDIFAGLVSREMIQKAIFHNLEKARVSDFMYTEMQKAGPDTPFSKIESVMVEGNQRFMPVVEGDRIIGAITRTDLLRTLHDDILMKPLGAEELPKGFHYTYSRNLRHLLKERLPANIEKLLRDIGEVAEEAGMNAYVVGGFVRDLLLGHENLDIDVVIEGDGIAFANKLGRRFNARVKAHQRFGTAVVILPDDFRIDIATARTEYYEYPTALPTVELSSIKKDLYRRDFTINTLAIKLNKMDYGNLIDFFGGQRDIKEKAIRALHNLSLVEDPTRVFRAIRFEQRFNFKIGKHTQNLIKTAVRMELFHKLSGKRVLTELRLIFEEAEPIKAIMRMAEFDLLRFIHPEITVKDKNIRLFERIKEAIAWFDLLFLNLPIEKWLIYFIGLLNGLSKRDIEDVLKRLAVPERFARKLIEAAERSEKALSEFYRHKKMENSRIYRLLHPLSTETVVFMMAKAKEEAAKKYISLYLTELRKIGLSITGNDLKKLGIKEGPLFRGILEKAFEKKLNGMLKTKKDELKFVKGLKSE
ncbi:MAG: CBS domain-containing protein [Nitrospirae bacterium]|nr:CBS domain-containing protein [Nitrospirota bacterium]